MYRNFSTKGVVCPYCSNMNKAKELKEIISYEYINKGCYNIYISKYCCDICRKEFLCSTCITCSYTTKKIDKQDEIF